MITEKDILNSLKHIIDPDSQRDIVTLGFVQNIKIDGGEVSFDIVLTTPACPIKGEFERQAKEAVTKIPGVTKVNIHMTSMKRSPAPSTPTTAALAQVKSIIAVSSCKGGVGKSTVAAYLAQELASRGFRVGLVDVDIHGPSIPTLFNLVGTQIYVNEKKQLIPVEKNNLKIMSFGFLLGDAPAVMRGPIVTRYVQQILLNTAWGELDYLFIDMPPGTGDVQLTITQTIQLSGAVIVTTPQTLSLIDVSRGILMFEKVNVPILGIIENMAYFMCDQCDKKHYIFGEQGAAQLQKRFGVEILAQLPLLAQLGLKIDKPLANDFIMRAVDKVVMALGKNSILQKQVPQIQFNAERITLNWTDGTQMTVSNSDLRLSCQCALCVNELTGKQILQPKDVRADIAPIEITPLGNYAIGVVWNDGHSSGIYPYDIIRQIANDTIQSNKG